MQLFIVLIVLLFQVDNDESKFHLLLWSDIKIPLEFHFSIPSFEKLTCWCFWSVVSKLSIHLAGIFFIPKYSSKVFCFHSVEMLNAISISHIFNLLSSITISWIIFNDFWNCILNSHLECSVLLMLIWSFWKFLNHL